VYSFTHRLVLDMERRQYSDIAKSNQHFRLLPAILDTVLDIRWYTNMIVLQSAATEATSEVLYNALMVSKTQLSLGCVSCR